MRNAGVAVLIPQNKILRTTKQNLPNLSFRSEVLQRKVLLVEEKYLARVEWPTERGMKAKSKVVEENHKHFPSDFPSCLQYLESDPMNKKSHLFYL